MLSSGTSEILSYFFHGIVIRSRLWICVGIKNCRCTLETPFTHTGRGMRDAETSLTVKSSNLPNITIGAFA